MRTATTSIQKEAPGVGRQRRRISWVTVLPQRQERRLYFLATVILAGWYLLDRLL
jgi:hypothetical protein